MDIKINSINVRREGDEVVGLQVYFTGKNGDSSINLSGYIPLEQGEFESHVDVPAVESIVRQKIIDRLINGESIEDAK